MSLLDGPLRGAATLLIRQAGATATLRRTTTQLAFASDQDVSTTVEATIKVSPPEPYRASRIDGTLVQIGDSMCLVSAQTLELSGISLPVGSLQNVSLQIGADKWKVISVNQLRSGDLVAALELQLRR